MSSSFNYFLHRDFQSQNIILFEGLPYFIDYQTAYSGSNFYDLASLLYDPYSAKKIESNYDFFYNYYKTQFYKIPNSALPASNDFDTLYSLTALQRNMQANAAYVKLGLIENKKFFAQFIDSTLSQICYLVRSGNDIPDYFKYIFNHIKK